MTKYRIVERIKCPDSTKTYHIQTKFLGMFWTDIDFRSFLYMYDARKQFEWIIKTKTCKNTETVVVEKEV